MHTSFFYVNDNAIIGNGKDHHNSHTLRFRVNMSSLAYYLHFSILEDVKME